MEVPHARTRAHARTQARARARTHTGAMVGKIQAHKSAVRAIMFDGINLYSSGDDKALKVCVSDGYCMPSPWPLQMVTDPKGPLTAWV